MRSTRTLEKKIGGIHAFLSRRGLTATRQKMMRSHFLLSRRTEAGFAFGFYLNGSMPSLRIFRYLWQAPGMGVDQRDFLVWTIATAAHRTRKPASINPIRPGQLPTPDLTADSWMVIGLWTPVWSTWVKA